MTFSSVDESSVMAGTETLYGLLTGNMTTKMVIRLATVGGDPEAAELIMDTLQSALTCPAAPAAQ